MDEDNGQNSAQLEMTSSLDEDKENQSHEGKKN